MIPTPTYRPSPIKRQRRTRSAISDVETAIYETLAADHPQTLRGLFYRLVSRAIVPKTEAAYKGLVGRLTVRMRRAGGLPYDWLADNTRWMRKPASHSSLESCLRRTAETYRRSLWDAMPAYVEVWLEKDALAGVLYNVTSQWDVPLMVTRGYPSLSYLFEAAEAIKAKQKPTYIYYLGDFDPSGVDIPRRVEADLRQLAPAASIVFQRVAVLDYQIDEWQLQTRPTKRTDSRARGFGPRSVEVDAIPSRTLRSLVEGHIARHVDVEQLKVLEAAEGSERDILERLASAWGS
jgi:hypothetical protein